MGSLCSCVRSDRHADLHGDTDGDRDIYSYPNADEHTDSNLNGDGYCDADAYEYLATQ